VVNWVTAQRESETKRDTMNRLDGAQSSPRPLDAHTQPTVIPRRHGSQMHPLSSGQQRIWFFEELAAGVPLHNESEAARLVGELSADWMEQAFNLIIARHEALRTTIHMTAEGPVAMVHADWLLRMKRIDLRALSPTERRTEVARLLIEEPRFPYDLEKEPGIRVTLVHVGPNEHVLILMFHHLVCDFGSMGILWRELSLAYRAISRGDAPSFNRLPIQYGDYAVWQQQRLREEDFGKDLAFWENNLRGAPELLALPSDLPRPKAQSYCGARQRFRLNLTLSQVLRDYSRQESISLFTIFTAAFAALLYRYTGSEDILIGIPIAERENQELQSVIGCLIHIQTLRTKVSGDVTFRELLARVWRGSMALYSHREVPFDQVVSKLRPQRDLSHSPLLQVMINWHDRDQQLSFIGLEGLEIEPLLSENGTSLLDLTLVVNDGGNEIWLDVEYNTDLFDRARIARMFGHYQTLLESVASGPNRRLAQLPLLTAAESRQLLAEWNATDLTFPQHTCVHELFEAQAQRSPEVVAVEFEGKQLRYRELNERANQVAHYLCAIGVRPGTLVGVAMERSLEMVVALCGVLKAGGTYVPLDPAYPRERLGFILRDCEAAVIVTQEKLRERFPEEANILCLDREWQRNSNSTSNLEFNIKATDLAYVIYTSGSTGQPKGVEITHRSVVNFLNSMREVPGIAAQDTLLSVTTLSFDIFGLELWLPLSTGAKVVLAPESVTRDGKELAALIQQSGASVMQATPSTWRLLLEAGWEGAPHLKLLCGGEAWSPQLAEQLLPKCASLWNMYGPTETTIWSAVQRVEQGQPIVIGHPIANTQFYVVDAHLQPVPVGIPGELFIGGEGLARCYLKRPELTAEKFIADPFSTRPQSRLYRTGDLVRYLADGTLEFLGRLDHQVKIRGFRIELGEIEQALRYHPRVGQCVAAARENKEGDKQLVAYIVSPDQCDAPSPGELRELLNGKLPEYMVPSAFVILDKLPLTFNGKIDRKALPAPELERASAQETGYVGPRTPLEKTLADIWSAILGMRRVGVRDNFFELGGYSLLATRLINKVHEALNYKLPIPQFFQNPTIEGVARILQDEKHTKDGHAVVLLKRGNASGTLFFLDAGLGLCHLGRQLNIGPTSFATEVGLPLAALQAAILNQQVDLPSLESLAAAHVALIRTCHRSGPCLLAGYSFGALLAFEVAHQLQRTGVSVAMILLLDSWARDPLWWEKLKVMSLDSQRPWGFWLSHLWLKMRARMLNGTARLTSVVDSNHSSAAPADVENVTLSEVSAATYLPLLHNIRERYKYRPLDSSALLFRCQNDLYSTNVMGGMLGWANLFIRGLEIVDTPGDHESMLLEPYVSALADRISDRLGRLFEGDDICRSPMAAT
jgi:amino acid adenylation domain-containing protein